MTNKKQPSFWCRMGWHKWTRWSAEVQGQYINRFFGTQRSVTCAMQTCECVYCGKSRCRDICVEVR